MRLAVIVDERDHGLEPAVELRHRKIGARLAQDLVGLSKLAVLSLQAFSFVATSVGTPARTPLSRSAFFTHSLSVWAVQPILAAINKTAAQREACSPS